MKLKEISDKQASDDIKNLDPGSKEAGVAFSKYLNSIKTPLSNEEFEFLTSSYYLQILNGEYISKAQYFIDHLHVGNELIDLDEDDFETAFKANPSYFDSSL